MLWYQHIFSPKSPMTADSIITLNKSIKNEEKKRNKKNLIGK